MRGVNRVMLIGNLGRDPELQYLEGHIPVAKFPLATTETYKDKSGTLVSQTEWHNIVLWRGLADLAHKYLHKGSLVFLEGRLRTRTWEDKDKTRRYATEIVGDNLVMLDKRKDNNEFQPNNNQAETSHFSPETNYDSGVSGAETKDDLPF